MTAADLDRVVEMPFNPTKYSVRHWLYYIVLKYGVLAAAVLIAFYVVYRLA